MTRFLRKYETICPLFKNHSCSLFFHRFLARKRSTNTVFFLLSAIFPITVESQHNFLRHRDLSRDLFFSGDSYVLNNRETSKNSSFQWHFKIGKRIHKYSRTSQTIPKQSAETILILYNIIPHFISLTWFIDEGNLLL